MTLSSEVETMPSSTLTLTIDGRAVEAREGMTVLDAARAAGIEIPTLCHLEGVSPFGACRMCVVEIRRNGRTRVVVSCLYPAEEGLVVETETDRIAGHRRVILELLAARWDRIDPALLERYGADPDRFEKRTTYCVLCGLCVRWCAEVGGRHVLGFVGRGTERQVVVYPHLAREHCPACAEEAGGHMPCLEACPTGVITGEFCVRQPGLPDRVPLAHPVCIKDDDNLREVARKVGDPGAP